ncbi:hypothetical protein Hanom_Chr07g00603131 [Helianthus anomalus]
MVCFCFLNRDLRADSRLDSILFLFFSSIKPSFGGESAKKKIHPHHKYYTKKTNIPSNILLIECV